MSALALRPHDGYIGDIYPFHIGTGVDTSMMSIPGGFTSIIMYWGVFPYNAYQAATPPSCLYCRSIPDVWTRRPHLCDVCTWELHLPYVWTKAAAGGYASVIVLGSCIQVSVLCRFRPFMSVPGSSTPMMCVPAR